MRRIGRARDGCNIALLNEPAQRDLRDRSPFALSELGDARIFEDLATCERTVRGQDDAQPATGQEHFRLIEIRMVFRLQRDERLGA